MGLPAHSPQERLEAHRLVERGRFLVEFPDTEFEARDAARGRPPVRCADQFAGDSAPPGMPRNDQAVDLGKAPFVPNDRSRDGPDDDRHEAEEGPGPGLGDDDRAVRACDQGVYERSFARRSCRSSEQIRPSPAMMLVEFFVKSAQSFEVFPTSGTDEDRDIHHAVSSSWPETAF
ncbi:MAG TPA: hypothetical protein VHG30_19430 [Microvirga sp.]|nr:hypothetical protein [Microvirga sp.]